VWPHLHVGGCGSCRCCGSHSRPESPDLEPQPQPLLTRAIPTAVWEDHLLPLLTCKEAARLGSTCRALREVVREHYVGDLVRGSMTPALRTFPRARSLEPYCDYIRGAEQTEALVKWLLRGGAWEVHHDDHHDTF
jgi:hypothetical protein